MKGYSTRKTIMSSKNGDNLAQRLLMLIHHYISNSKHTVLYTEMKTIVLVVGLAAGFIWVIIFGAFGLAFWYGNELVRENPDDYEGGNVVQVINVV